MENNHEEELYKKAEAVGQFFLEKSRDKTHDLCSFSEKYTQLGILLGKETLHSLAQGSLIPVALTALFLAGASAYAYYLEKELPPKALNDFKQLW